MNAMQFINRMKKQKLRLVKGVLALMAACALSLPVSAAPKSGSHVGYAYPAGGQQGQTLTITLGGKGLKQGAEIWVSGEGISAKVVAHIPNYKRRLQEHVRFIQRERFSQKKDKAQSQERRFGLPPEHPYFDVWQTYSDAEFKQMLAKFNQKERVQRNNEIDELLVVQLSIAANAELGRRELYVKTTTSVSNPIRFMVNALPEVYEQEPNDALNSQQPLHSLPFVANGQIQPGDIDSFYFHAQKGQQLVVQVQARELIPYLADAVPGWFQAVIKLYDAHGNAVAFADDFRFNPDPVLHFIVPETGNYSLVIHDAIYRGREDFVYRILVGELPFVTSIFPLGGQAGKHTEVELTGWNLPYHQLRLNTDIQNTPFVTGTLNNGNWRSNSIKYGLSQEPELFEIMSPNNELAHAQTVSLPCVINGRIEQAGDTDFYQFEGKAGESIHMEVIARRLNSPMDPLIRLFDSEQQVLQWNDDEKQTVNTGVLTHYADSAMHYSIKKTGRYYVQVADSQSQGGDAFSYRLLMTEPKPDFDLYVTPSAFELQPGGSQLLHVYAVRKQGFNGEIQVGLYNATAPFELSGNRIPAGVDDLTMVIRLPQEVKAHSSVLDVVGVADFSGQTLMRHAIPASEQTQAFMTHHLVEASELKVFVTGKKSGLSKIYSLEAKPIQLSAGGHQHLDVALKSKGKPQHTYALKGAADGLHLQAEQTAKGVRFVISAESQLAVGSKGNLIIEVFNEVPAKGKNSANKMVRYSLGFLPAIPFEIIE